DVRVVDRRALRLPVLDDGVDLFLVHVRPVHAGQRRGARRQDEHVAHAEQVLRARRVDDGGRVVARGDLEGDAGGKVGLDQASDDVGGRALRGHHEMYAGGAGNLREAGDVRLDLARGRHPQIGRLV